MKTKSIFIIAACILSIFLMSCNKSIENEIIPIEEISNQSKHNEKTVIDKTNIISLQDQEAFKALYTFLMENQDNEQFLINHIKNNFNITSIREIYKTGMQIVDENDFLDYINKHPNVFITNKIDGYEFFDFPGSNLMSYLLNNNGMLIVGDTIIRLDSEFLYVNKVESSDSENGKVLTFGDVIEKRHYRIKSSEATLKGEYSYKTAYWGKARRIVARLHWNDLYWSIDFDAQTTAQRRYFGVWIQEQANAVGISHSGGFVKKYNGNPVEYFGAQSWQNNNQADIRRTVWQSFDGSFPIPLPWSSCKIKHSGLRSSTWIYVNDNEMFDY